MYEPRPSSSVPQAPAGRPAGEWQKAPLGTLLFRAGLVPAEELEAALAHALAQGRRLGEVLLERGLIAEHDLARALAAQRGLEAEEATPARDRVRLATPAAEPGVPAARAGGACSYQVLVRLSNGEGVPIGAPADRARAHEEARELIRRLDEEPGDWPLIGDRFLRPDAIVSVDIAAFGDAPPRASAAPPKQGFSGDQPKALLSPESRSISRAGVSPVSPGESPRSEPDTKSKPVTTRPPGSLWPTKREWSYEGSDR